MLITTNSHCKLLHLTTGICAPSKLLNATLLIPFDSFCNLLHITTNITRYCKFMYNTANYCIPLWITINCHTAPQIDKNHFKLLCITVVNISLYTDRIETSNRSESFKFTWVLHDILVYRKYICIRPNPLRKYKKCRDQFFYFV